MYFPMMPYSDLYTLNLDWVVKAATEAKKATENIAAFAGVDAVANSTEQASVDLDIVDNHYRFTFGLPRGIAGAPGIPGRDGQDGRNGNQFIFGTSIDGHTDGVAFNAPASIQRTFYFGDIYINTNSGNAYHVTTAGTGADAKLLFLFNMKGQAAPVEQAKTRITFANLNRPADSGALAAGTSEGRIDFGTFNIPAHTVAYPIFWNESHWYYTTSGMWIGPRTGVTQHSYYVNSTDTAQDVPVSGFVLNISNASRTALDLGQMTFALIPEDSFELYTASETASQDAAAMERGDFETGDFETGTPGLSIGTMVQPTVDIGLS